MRRIFDFRHKIKSVCVQVGGEPGGKPFRFRFPVCGNIRFHLIPFRIRERSVFAGNEFFQFRKTRLRRNLLHRLAEFQNRRIGVKDEIDAAGKQVFRRDFASFPVEHGTPLQQSGAFGSERQLAFAVLRPEESDVSAIAGKERRLLDAVAEITRAERLDFSCETVGCRAEGERGQTRLLERNRTEESAHLLDASGFREVTRSLRNMIARKRIERDDAFHIHIQHLRELKDHPEAEIFLRRKHGGIAIVKGRVPFGLDIPALRCVVFAVDFFKQFVRINAVGPEQIIVTLNAEFGFRVIERDVASSDSPLNYDIFRIDGFQSFVSGLHQLDKLLRRRLAPENASSGQMRLVPELPETNLRIAFRERLQIVAPGGKIFRSKKAVAGKPDSCILRFRRIPARRSEGVQQNAALVIASGLHFGKIGINLRPVVLSAFFRLYPIPVCRMPADKRICSAKPGYGQAVRYRSKVAGMDILPSDIQPERMLAVRTIALLRNGEILNISRKSLLRLVTHGHSLFIEMRRQVERLLDRTPSPVFPDEEELNRVESGL